MKAPWTVLAEAMVRVAEINSDAARYCADKEFSARVREARLRRPDLTPKYEPPEERDPQDEAFDEWEEANLAVPLEQRQYLRWAMHVLLNREKVPQEKRLEAMRLWEGAVAKGYELPALPDGRVPVSAD